MANKDGHRSFGNVRRRESGRWQARYRGPDGQLRSAPNTFATKREALQWLSITESQMLRGEWTDPDRAKIELRHYADKWITERPNLRPRTVQLYRWLFRKHIDPHLGGVHLSRLSTAVVREWRSNLLTAGVSQSIAAKSYRLLRAILNTATDEDRLLPRNPCRVRGADRETPDERPVLTVAQVFDLAGRMRFAQYRALILLTAFATLRWGEVTALRRCDVGQDVGWVRISRAHTEVTGRGVVVGPPKSRAGVRTIVVPSAVRADLVAHLAEYVESGPDALLFTGIKGNAMRRANFNPLVRWTQTVTELGVPGLHFHDLRHSGNVWAAQAGSSTKDLMARMGHDDMRAALIYQRATSEAQQQIAERLSKLVDDHRQGDAEDGAAGGSAPNR